MATANQRAISIVDALVNGTSTTNQRNRISAAFGENLPAGSSSSDISQNFLTLLRGYVMQKVEDFEARASVASAKATVAADVATSFPEAP